MTKHMNVLRKVKKVLEDDDQVKKIMENYKKQDHKQKRSQRIKDLLIIAGVEYIDYIQALLTSRTGYSVVQQRDLDEININSYNVEWMRAWNGNMDIKVVLDYFAIITYVTDYYSKDDTGTMEVIKAALEQSDAKNVKDKMKIVSNAFLTHRQMGEAEAVYKLLPAMNLKRSNVACQWVSLGTKKESHEKGGRVR